MEETKISLRTKIILFTVAILVLSVTLTSIFVTKWAIDSVKQRVRVNNMNTAINIANAPFLGDIISKGDPGRVIQKYTQNILNSVKDVDMVVVADMEGIRYAHPNMERLGQKFVGGDEKRVIETGESYISEATGTLGQSLRAFAPIYDSNGNQVGFVMVGTLIEGIIANQYRVAENMVIYALGGLILGIIGAIILSFNIKKSLLGLEPYQISRLYTEKNCMLEAMQEGILAIDDKGQITMINDSARKILDVKEENVINKKIIEIFPNNGLEKILDTGISEFEKEQEMNGINIVTNIVPIINQDKIIGAMATIRDKTMVTKLAEEITGVNQIVEALRANTHEFMNKLHVILGLIQTGDLDQVKRYIADIREHQQQITSAVMNKIKDPTVAGLVLGKYSRAKELGVKLELCDDSILERFHGKIHSSVIVTVLGNFIENALESTAEDGKAEKKVSISIIDQGDNIEIKVSDTGTGIKEDDIGKIFTRGYSTKSNGRGVGLSLVKEKVDNLGGEIKLSSVLGQGTVIIATIPKEG